MVNRRANPRQRDFVKHYLGAANENATEAARMAGYPHAEDCAHRILRSPVVQELIREKAADGAMPPSEVLSRLTEIAGGDLGKFLEQDASGQWKLSLEKAKKSCGTQVLKKVRVTRYTTEVELHSPLEALDKLARYHGLYNRGQSQEGLEDKPATDEHGNPVEP